MSTVCWCGHQECPVVRHERTQCVDACTVCLRAELAAARAHVEALVANWTNDAEPGPALDAARAWLGASEQVN